MTMENLHKININSSFIKERAPIIPVSSSTQGLTSLLVMVMILCIILIYCLWGAPWCRAFVCKKLCFCCNFNDDLENNNSEESSEHLDETNNPTIILLSQGQFLVVDNSIIPSNYGNQACLNNTNQSRTLASIPRPHLPKRLCFRDYFPPSYDSIFGKYFVNSTDLPPSYSDLSLQTNTSSRVLSFENLPTTSGFASESLSTLPSSSSSNKNDLHYSN